MVDRFRLRIVVLVGGVVLSLGMGLAALPSIAHDTGRSCARRGR